MRIWYGYDYKMNVMGFVFLFFYKMKLIMIVYGWVRYIKCIFIYYWVDCFLMWFYDKVICVFDDFYECCFWVGVKEDCCELIENVIDISYFFRCEDEKLVCEKYGF